MEVPWYRSCREGKAGSTCERRIAYTGALGPHVCRQFRAGFIEVPIERRHPSLVQLPRPQRFSHSLELHLELPDHEALHFEAVSMRAICRSHKISWTTEQGIELRTNNDIVISLGSLLANLHIFRLVATEDVVLDKLTKTIVLQTGNARGRVKQTRPTSMSFIRAVGFHPKPPPQYRSF
jgi:hypothetical protein